MIKEPKLRGNSMCSASVLAVLAVTMLASGSSCAGSRIDRAAALALLPENERRDVVVQSNCIYSIPAKNVFTAYKRFGFCLVTNEALRIYKDDKKASLAFESPISSIQEYSFHTDTFTLVTTAGNFGLVLDDSVKDSAKFIGTMQSRGVAENRRLPEFKAKDAGPYSFP